jgi:hypothetical protein
MILPCLRCLVALWCDEFADWKLNDRLFECCERGELLKVAVLVSGGVDSSVALRLLCEAGHNCTAFYLKIWFQVPYEVPFSLSLSLSKFAIHLLNWSSSTSCWTFLLSLTPDLSSEAMHNSIWFCRRILRIFGQSVHGRKILSMHKQSAMRSVPAQLLFSLFLSLCAKSMHIDFNQFRS